MTRNRRFGLLMAGVLMTVPALYAPSGQADSQKKASSDAHQKPGSNAPTEGGGGIETAVLVLDASGSMSEKIGNETKMKIAQDAVRKLIAGWDADVPLGLTAYGHRTPTCDDIETILPIGPVDRKLFMKTVDELQPKDSTPLTK